MVNGRRIGTPASGSVETRALQGYERRQNCRSPTPDCRRRYRPAIRGASRLARSRTLDPAWSSTSDPPTNPARNPGKTGRLAAWPPRDKSGAGCRDAISRFSIFAGYSSTVNKVVLSPDGSTLASASDDHTVRLWNVADGRDRRTILELAMANLLPPQWTREIHYTPGSQSVREPAHTRQRTLRSTPAASRTDGQPLAQDP
ncbi:MAG: WD40 domain-containing protein [Alphaproteobacteria bacterium]|nr:WD40 domain-containing protein [Alphaproteobacteria bacterium]